MKALALGFLLAKPTQEFDFITLSAQSAALIPVNGTPAKGSTPAGPTRAQFILDFASAVTELVNAEILIPTAVKWPIPMLPAKSNVTIKYQVRVIYDLLKISLGNPDGVPTSIANNNYNFTIAASGKALSALYGAKPAPVSTALILTAPAAEPVIALSKFAYGDHDLNNPNLHGNGSQIIAGLGELTTAIQGHGFDFELFYYNYGANDAHDVVIHETIPAGAVLSGYFKQSVNGVPPPLDGGMVAEQISYYDALGNLIPSATAVLNYAKVKSMDIRLSGFNNLTPLKSGDYGTIRYTITPTVAAAAAGKPPTFIQSLGGYDSTRKRSDPLQGAYITCADLSTTVSAFPDSLLVKVISDVSFDLHYTKGAYTAKPLDYVPFDFTLNQNGDATSGNTPVNFVIPQGAILATDTNTDMQHGPKYSDGTPGGPTVTVTGQNATLNFGSIAGHVKHTFRIYLQVNLVSGDFDPVLKDKKRLFFETDPAVTPSLITAAHLSARSADRTVLSTPPQTVPPSAATTKQTVQLLDPTAAHLSVTRSSPYTVDPSQNFNYIIAFTNSGDVDATNVKVGMQIPYFTHFVSTTNGSVTVIGQGTQPNSHAYDKSNLRTPAQVKATGAGPNIITWPFGTLPAHSSGSITVTVQVQPGFVNDCIRDHSLYVSADNAASAVLCPNPIGTWVVGKNFDVSKWEVLGCFCEHLGIPINKTTSPALQAYVTGLTRTSKVHVVGGLDFLQMRNGAMVFPLGHNQVIALVSERGGGLTTGPGSQVISNDGGSILATGDANAITINGLITGGPLVSTSATAQLLLQNAAGIIAAGGGNIIAAGGGNLISQDGAGFSLLSNEVGGASSLIHAITAGIIAAGGGNAVANGWGLIVGAGLISQDGAGLISQDGAGLISQDGAGLLSLGVASLVVTSSGQVISNDGGSVISNDGGSLIGEGGSTFKGGPAN